MRERRRKQVFVSYSPADREIPEKLIEELAVCGMIVPSAEQIPQGQNQSDWMDEVVKESDSFIVVVGPQREAGEQQQREWRAVLEEKWRTPTKQLIPVLIDGSKIPNFLSRFHAFKIKPGAKRLPVNDLIEALKKPGDLGKPDNEGLRQFRERLDYIGEVARSLKE